VSHAVRLPRGPVERIVIQAALAIVGLQVLFLVALVGGSVVQSLPALFGQHEGFSCTNDATVALNHVNRLACVPPGTELPHGWVVVREPR
jgi:hypothetical protein